MKLTRIALCGPLICLFWIFDFANAFPQALEEKRCAAQSLLASGAKVLSVADGDSVKLQTTNGRIVSARLVGIDTPESFYRGKTQGEWAYKASKRLREILPRGSYVEVQLDRLSCDARHRALVHLFKEKVHINRLLIEEGWAVNYCVAPNFLHCEEFGALAEINKILLRGFLGDPSIDLPYLFRAKQIGSDFSFFVGDILNHQVFKSDQIDLVPLGRRVIFYSTHRIRSPYQMASGY